MQRIALITLVLTSLLDAPSHSQELLLSSSGVVSAALLGEETSSLTLPLGGQLITAERESSTTRLSTDGIPIVTWRGQVQGSPGSSVVLTLRRGMVAGSISTPDGVWYLSPKPDGSHSIESVDFEAALPCGTEAHEDESSPPSAQRIAHPDRIGTSSTIDLVLLYSRKTLEVAGGLAQLEAVLANAVDLANDAMIRSDIDIKFRAVAMELFAEYDEDIPSQRGSTFFSNHADVTLARERHQADIVAGIVEGGIGTCGRATLFAGPERFEVSIILRECIPSFAFTHELGHNLGARHDRITGAPAVPEGLPDNGYGHAWCVSPRGKRTVMYQADPGCVVDTLNQFSNPEVFFEGQPTGIAGSADNATVLQAAAPVVADYRPGPCLPTETALCLSQSRIEVTARFRTSDGTEGDAIAVPFTPDGGYFYFFIPSNPELMVKVLNACANPSFRFLWFFAAGLTNVEVTLTATNKETGESKTYVNPLGTPFVAIQDTAALMCE